MQGLQLVVTKIVHDAMVVVVWKLQREKIFAQDAMVVEELKLE